MTTSLKGYVLVETLVAVSIAALGAGAGLQLLSWAVRETAKTQALTEQTRAVSFAYEQARLATRKDLDVPAAGRSGLVTWTRRADFPMRISPSDAGPAALHIEAARPGVRPLRLEALIWPAA